MNGDSSRIRRIAISNMSDKHTAHLQSGLQRSRGLDAASLEWALDKRRPKVSKS